MVNKTVLNYLKKHHGEYRTEDLKQKIISVGYSEEEFEEALNALNFKKSVEPAKAPEIPPQPPKFFKEAKEVTKLPKLPVKKTVPQPKFSKEVIKLPKLVIKKPVIKPIPKPLVKPITNHSTKPIPKPLVKPITKLIVNPLTKKIAPQPTKLFKEAKEVTKLPKLPVKKTVPQPKFSKEVKEFPIKPSELSAKKIIAKPKPLTKPLVKPLTKKTKIDISEVFTKPFVKKPMLKPVAKLFKGSILSKLDVSSVSELTTEPVTEASTFVIGSRSVSFAVYSRWLKTAGISGILTIIFVFLFYFSENFFGKGAEVNPMPISAIFLLSASLFFILFLYGFVILGKRHNRKLIEVVGLIFLIFMILIIIFQGLLLIFPSSLLGSVLVKEIFSVVQGNFAFSIFSSSIIARAFLLFVGLNILFGISLITLWGDVRYARAVGILHTLGAGFLIIQFNVLVLFVIFLLETFWFFKISRGI